MLLKYLVPFILSMLFFLFTGFCPIDCDTSATNSSTLNTSSSELDSCYFEGIPLRGKVKFVESFPDFKVKFVTSFPDLKVKFVSSFPDDCGEWQIVESFPDFTIKVVESFPDVEIKVVESFPGLP